MAKEKTKNNFTPLEKAWIAYDIGNSAFTMMCSTLISIWFYALTDLVGMDRTVDAYPIYNAALSIVTVCVAFIGPVFGTIADNKGFKKPIFTTSLLIGTIGCAVIGLSRNWLLYIVVFVIAKTAYQACNVFYDSMLVDVTTEERMDAVSSQGYAWGYIGSCIPFTVALVFYVLGPKWGLSDMTVMSIDMIIIALWWFGVTVPLLNQYHQKYYVEASGSAVKDSLVRLWTTLKTMAREDKKVFYFLIAFFFYIDGVYTIIDDAVAIGTVLGLDTIGLLGILLGTQVVAWIFSLVFGKLSEKYDSILLISVCIGGYTFVAIYALFMKTLMQFLFMAFVVGMFQGTIQALSRSYYGKIIPPSASGEYFGVFDICGKGAAFLGTTMMAIVTPLTGSVNVAVGTLALLFILGFIFLRMAAKTPAKQYDK